VTVAKTANPGFALSKRRRGSGPSAAARTARRRGFGTAAGSCSTNRPPLRVTVSTATPGPGTPRGLRLKTSKVQEVAASRGGSHPAKPTNPQSSKNTEIRSCRPPRRGAGVVERGGLENRCGRKSTQGSNPCLSATEALLPPVPANGVLHSDKSYDSGRIRQTVEARGSPPNIPPRKTRKWKNCFSP
jgi:hypothetical protein